MNGTSLSQNLKSPKLPAALFAGLFILFGVLVIQYPGIQNDEAVFASALYPPYNAFYKVANVPFMVMDYAGCVKTWIYSVIFHIFPPSIWSLRIPVVLVGSLTVALFTLMIAKAGRLKAAWIGGALLVTDPSFAMTNNFDWGPVALQHLFLVAGLFSAMKFHRTSSVRWIGIAGFSFGMGLWDKALFSWLLIPVCLATIAMWPVMVRRHLTVRAFQVFAFGFLIGVAPLLWFNLRNHWITFRSHAHFSVAQFHSKLMALHYTAQGSVMFGYMVRGAPRAEFLEWGFAAGLIGLVFSWRSEVRRPAVFSLITMTLAWLAMVLNRDTGGAAHHIILLWPLPQFFIAVVVARYRFIGVILSVVLVVTNIFVLQRYWSNLRTEGTESVWTDALGALSNDPALVNATSVCVIDWGIIDPLQILHQGRLHLLAEASNVLTYESSESATEELARQLQSPTVLWISHVTGKEQFVGVNARLLAFAEQQGLHRRSERIYNDTHGQPMFQAFRFVMK